MSKIFTRVKKLRIGCRKSLSWLTSDAKDKKDPVSKNKKKASSSKLEDCDSVKFHSKSMVDSRCTLVVDKKENTNKATSTCHQASKDDESNDLIDMIAKTQSKRMNEQRVELSHLPNLPAGPLQNSNELKNNNAPDDTFLDQLVRCQASRLDDQRSQLLFSAVENEENKNSETRSQMICATAPDEDFFSLVMRVQGRGIDNQRATFPQVDQKDKKINGDT